VVTRVGLAKFWMTIWLADPQTPQFFENSGTYLKCELSYCDFCVEISKIFVTLATGVGLTQISLTRLNWQSSKTPIWRKNLDDISYTSWVIANFLIKFTKFCYRGNEGGSSENLNDSVWSPTPKPPVWCKIMAPILNVSWVIVICVWKFPNFRYHGNRVGLTQIILT